MTDEPTPYGPDDYLELLLKLSAGFASYSAPSGRMTITADVEWAGEFNPTRHRTTTLLDRRPLGLVQVRELTAAGMGVYEAAQRVFRVPEPAIPKTLPGQVNWLHRTAAGRAAALAAGFTPAAGTVRRWKAGTQHPSRRYAEALEQAAAAYRQERAGRWRARRADARARLDPAAAAVGDELTDEIGEPVRFFNISDLYFR